MQVGAGRAACIARTSNLVTLIDNLARRYIDSAQMTVVGLVSVAMINNDQVTIPVDIPTGPGDRAGIGRQYGRPFG